MKNLYNFVARALKIRFFDQPTGYFINGEYFRYDLEIILQGATNDYFLHQTPQGTQNHLRLFNLKRVVYETILLQLSFIQGR